MFNRKFLEGIWAIVVLLPLIGVETGAADDSPQFDRHIAPLLKARCVKCHGVAKLEGKLNLSTAVGAALGGETGAAIQPGNLDNSQLWLRVDAREMPPDSPLSDGELALLRSWISDGAPGLPTPDQLGTAQAEHWSFRLLQPVAVPNVRNAVGCRNEVDRFLQSALESRGLGIGPEADRSTLIRRVSFDLTGLPPTVAEISTFLFNPAENANSQMLNGYLSKLQFGEHWGKYWLDIVGYADSNGYFDSDTQRPLAYRYRDYVIRSINSDKPFDQFIREQLAGDELAGPNAERDPTPQAIDLLVATHFLRNAEDGTADSNGNPNEVLRDRHAVLDATVEIFGSALFGITLQCAKCHDHKFEPVTQRDYYGLQAVLAPAFDIDHWIVPNDRIVIAATPSENANFAKVLASGKTTEAQRPGQIAAVKDVSPVPPDVFVLKRGDFLTPGEKVSPSGLTALGSSDSFFANHTRQPGRNSTGYRLAFAEWLTGSNTRSAALLARLQVNRIWQRYFGTGLVATPSNLGYSGDPPTHPELLDWLAGQFVNSGWSSKTVHRLILESAAYRQSSAINEVAFKIDPDNRLLWRMPLRRLGAEEIYDAMLAMSGELESTMGGPATPTIREDVGLVSVAEKLPGGKRRAVYLQQRRTQIPTILAMFDAPSIVTNCVERPASTVPLQSLALMNSEFTLTRAASFAKRIALEAGLDNDARIERTFLLTFARVPDASELRASLQFIREQARQYLNVSPVPQRRAWVDFCHSMMASNAFLYLE